MKLYHVRLANKTWKPKDVSFKARIPENRMTGEIGEIPRICFSDSMEGAFTAMGLVRTIAGEVENKENIHIEILSIETDEIDKNLIKDYTVLDQLGILPDAYLTHEHWYIGKDAIILKTDGIFTIKSIEFERIHILPNIQRYSYCESPCSIDCNTNSGSGFDINVFTKVEIIPFTLEPVYNPIEKYDVFCNDEEGVVVKKKRTAFTKDYMELFKI